MWARGEAYKYEDTEAESPSVKVENDGYRATLGAAYKRLEGWMFRADYYIDKGPGSRSTGFNALASWRLMQPLQVTGDVQQLIRPLEFRFDDAELWSYGLRFDYETISGLRLNAGLRYYDEKRNRPDAAAFSWNNIRLNLGAMVNFGSRIAGTLHPAILSIPEVRGSR